MKCLCVSNHSNSDCLDRSEILTRRTATVTTSAPDYSSASASWRNVGYLPVPTKRLDENSRPAIISLSLSITPSKNPPLRGEAAEGCGGCPYRKAMPRLPTPQATPGILVQRKMNCEINSTHSSLGTAPRLWLS